MHVEASYPGKLLLRLSADEIGECNNALNEVCNGIAVSNLDAALGVSAEHAANLLSRVHSAKADVPLEFALEELLAIRNALTLVLAELDSREFETRMGIPIHRAKQMRDALDSVTGSLRHSRTA